MQLTREQAKEYINAHPEQHLQRDKSGKGWICPLCGNGSGSDGDGLREHKRAGGGHYKCFKCGFYGDLIELIAQEQGLDGGSSEAFKAAREAYQIRLIPDVAAAKGKEVNVVLKDPIKVEEQEATKAYIKRCHRDIEQGKGYLSKRGISTAVAAEHWVGYDTDKQALVIPSYDGGDLGYVLRYTNPAMNIRYQNAEGLSVGLFNSKALDNIGSCSPCFVVEGAIDALSIIQMGFKAVALNSGNNIDKFLQLVERFKVREEFPLLLVAMDNDVAGKGFADKLSEGLNKAGVAFRIVELSDEHKDANELLMSNPERLRANLNRAINPAIAEVVDAHKVGSLIQGFKAYVQDSANNRSVPTGFKSFDKAIGGGLFPKLYMIGAISSLGKTTFCLQIADAIAAQGHDVIIFSLEMAKEDIMARSISRHTYLIAKEQGNERLAKTELGIVAYERYAGYSDAEKACIGEAYKRYTAYADERISIYEGRHTAEEIRRKVENYINFTGRKPVVFVDYLQIVQPSESLRRATVREQVDNTIDAFTAMRRELKIPVVVVSSFNRSSYNTVADNTAFKESGTIEYSADCTITLELDIRRSDKAGAGKDTNGAKADTLDAMRGADGKREIKLTFQKNRGNRVGSVIHFLYNAKFNYFKEDESKPPIL